MTQVPIGSLETSSPAPGAESLSVLFLTRSLEYGGSERQLVQVAKGLSERGHRVAVASFYGGGPLEEDLKGTLVKLVDLRKRGRWDLLGFLFRLVKLARRARPVVLHGYLVVPNLLTILLKPLLPGTRVVWGVRASNMDLSEYDWLARLTFGASCRLARHADRILANSRAGADYHAGKGYPRETMVVIQNGIDTFRFRPDSDGGSAVRREWGVRDRGSLVGLVGRLDPMKDHPTFLEALAQLRNERPTVRAVCVGDGPAEYRRRLEEHCRSLDLDRSVIWAGTRSDMRAVYSALDVVCLSSKSEGFPNVVAEAMACGVPCVVTDVGDAREIVGETGRVVRPGLPRELARAIQMQLDETSLDLQEACRRRVRRHFDLQGLIDETEEALWPRTHT